MNRLFALALAGCGWFEAATTPLAPSTVPPAVVFVVVDTLRADHASLCGYSRPTTPNLAALAAEGRHTCRAYAPAPWTLPSHASYFTGLTVPDHGADLKGRPMPPDVPTLAGHFAAQGYQTVLVSANPVLGRESGLTRDFQTVVVSGEEGRGRLRGRDFPDVVAETLAGLDPERPLFLFVNIFDAHDPYPAIPADVGWVPERGRLDFAPKKKKSDQPYDRFLSGEMSAEERAAWLAHVTDTYDYGVWQADENLGRIIGNLDSTSFVRGGRRLVVTSDHGEFLGEHDQLRHGGFVYEPVVNVPFVWVDPHEPRDLVEPLSAMNAFGWLTGRGDVAVAHAVSTRNPQNQKVGVDAVAVWRSLTEKHVWWQGERVRFDLSVDPGEATRVPLDGASPALDGLVHRFEAHRAKTGGENPALVEQLQEIGYLE